MKLAGHKNTRMCPRSRAGRRHWQELCSVIRSQKNQQLVAPNSREYSTGIRLNYLIGTLFFAGLGSFLSEIARNHAFRDDLELQITSRNAAGVPSGRTGCIGSDSEKSDFESNSAFRGIFLENSDFDLWI